MNGQSIVYETLDKMDIKYEAVEHPEVYTMEEMQMHGLHERGSILKNLFLRDAKGKRHFLVVVTQEKAVDLKKLETLLESTKLSFGSDERLAKHLGLKKGAVSPFGVLNDENDAVELAFDKDIVGCECVGVHPNDNTATIYLSFADLERFVKTKKSNIRYINL